MEIKVAENFMDTESCALLLRTLFDRRALWEDRQDRKLAYRNGSWYTFGASCYLDLKDDTSLPAYVQKVNYFNQILFNTFPGFLHDFTGEFSRQVLKGMEVEYLADSWRAAALPGFHIFQPEETLQVFFGRLHKDLQWMGLKKVPGFPFQDELEHFSFTLPLALPYQGGGMAIPSGDDPDAAPDLAYLYEEGNLYYHSGQFLHSVLPFKHPVLPLDWRITFQGHGFIHKEKAYLYW